MDYRITENRLESFILWYAWSLHYKDCDPAMWMINYLNKRYEHNTEQKLWFCWLYANTYYLPTAWVLFNEFPDYELATVDRLYWWNDLNYKRLRYQVDTKYNKGRLPEMFASYQDNMKKFAPVPGRGIFSTQRSFFNQLAGDNERETFNNLWKYIIDNFHKFGRYTAWFYLQALAQTADVPAYPTSLMLSDYSGSKSHRNGLLYAVGWDELVDVKLDAAQYNDLEDVARDIMLETARQYPHLSTEVNPYTMETALCAYKKLFRARDSRYLGYYLDRQAEEITKVSNDGWYGIQWEVLWQARKETLDSRLLNPGIQKNKFTEFFEAGRIDKLDWELDPYHYKNQSSELCMFYNT